MLRNTIWVSQVGMALECRHRGVWDWRSIGGQVGDVVSACLNLGDELYLYLPLLLAWLACVLMSCLNAVKSSQPVTTSSRKINRHGVDVKVAANIDCHPDIRLQAAPGCRMAKQGGDEGLRCVIGWFIACPYSLIGLAARKDMDAGDACLSSKCGARMTALTKEARSSITTVE